MELKQLLEELYSLGSKERINPNINNIKNVLLELSNPQFSFETIHITGTNGKGTTSALIYDILKTKYKVGLYTSPHLINFNERIRVNDKLILDKEIIKIYLFLKPFIKKYNLTFFEVTTIIAFIHFQNKKVDIAVIEVGMGGKWDATNVVDSLISIITRIDIDHSNYLGSQENIVKEKSGIIKENKTTITLANNVFLEIIKDKCIEMNNKLILVDDFNYDVIFKENTALALRTIDEIENKFPIDKSLINKIISNFEFPGRFHFLKKNILLDGAHNLNGIKFLIKNLKNYVSEFEKVVVVFGCSKDKPYKNMIKELSSIADEFVFLEGDYWKSQNVDKLIEVGKNYTSSILYSTKKIKSLCNDKKVLYVITGSLYLLGEIYCQF